MPTPSEINSIARAAEVLKYLAGGVSKLTEISRRLEVNKASVHRIMKTLKSKGLVSQDPTTRKYYLGPLIQALAENPVMVHRILTQLALPEMERLRKHFNETVVLQIRRGGQRMILEKAESSQAIRYFPEKAEMAPVHAGAAGKVLLAQMDGQSLANLLDRLELVKVGPNTITNKNHLISELEKIRLQNYAVSNSETVSSAAAIAVPVKNYTCPVALVIVGPDDRIREMTELIIAELTKSAERISAKILEVSWI